METGSKAVGERVRLDPLAACLANGDPRAPRELVERHQAELYRYALAMLRNASVAEDVVQEAFERAFVALGRYPEERIRALALRAWMYRITLNVVRNLARDRRRELPVAEMPDLGDEDREAWLDVLAALERLPDRQRVAVILRYIQDLPYSEIADITGTPLNTAKTLTRRGVERLRILLTDPDLKGGSK
jgi:RNA polymerase sigma-70 factor (ECF subfamily)